VTQQIRLGKRKTTRDPRTLRLARYLVDVPALERAMPRTWNGYRAVEQAQRWPMYGNDELGDCVVAASAHMVELWRANAARERIDVDDHEVLAAYWTASGGPGPPPASYTDYARRDAQYDNGLDPLAYLHQWQNTGIGGHKAGAYAQVDASNPLELRVASWLFGGLFVGLELPANLSANPFAPWVMHTHTLTGGWEPGSWGGHMVNNVYTNPDGGYLISWGSRIRYSWAFLRAFADVIFAVLSEDWLDGTRRAPNGFDFDQLRTDLEAIR
jgi:hypothetical protein